MTIVRLCPNHKDNAMQLNCHERFVGIDVSKEWIDVAYKDGCVRIKQSSKEIDEKLKQIKNQNPELCIVESTGGYERLIVDRLHANGLKIHVAHPTKVRHFAKARGLLAKTDKLDAYVLAAYGEFLGEDARLTKPDVNQQKLQDLQARCEQLKGMLHAEMCRKANVTYKTVKNDIQDTIEFLGKKIAVIMNEIQEMINCDPDLKSKQELLCSMKGVGKVTSQTMLVGL